MACEEEYRRLRKKTQSILETGTQDYGVSSTFAEMTTSGTEETLDEFFGPGVQATDAVVLDVGSGLGNFPFRAALRHGARAIGIELNAEAHGQTVSLLGSMLRTRSFDGYKLAGKCFFVYGEAEKISSLEGVTHLYMFNKNMPHKIFANMASVAARCRTLKYVSSHYDLRKPEFGWKNLSLVKSIASTLTGSGAGVRTLVYRVEPGSKRGPVELFPDIKHEELQPSHALRMMEKFKSWSVEDVAKYWVIDL